MSSPYCNQCPRQCNSPRGENPSGYCRAPATLRIARAALHPWEEPPVSGIRGSGTVFFAGCSLRCVFCQNKKISRGASGRVYSEDELIRSVLELRDKGAHNINLVTPTHYVSALVRVLEKVKPLLRIPVVWNSGGYESVESLKRLEGLVDVYLPDLKYYSPELSERYSAAPDYFAVASKAIAEMYRQTGDVVLVSETATDKDGEEKQAELIKKGVIVRHLVLPSCRKDSVRVVEELAKIVPSHGVRLSLMRQFTPDFVDKEAYPELARRVTSFEYDSVVKRAGELGFDGYVQDAASASAAYTPDFE